MALEFKLPELGENVEKGDVVRVLVSVGDTIQAEQALLELETDKATIEVPSSIAGVVKEVRVKAGDKVKVGQVVLVAEQDAAAAPPAAAKTSAPPAAATPAASAENRPVASAPAEPARHEVIDINTARPAAAVAARAADARPAPV